MQGYATGTYRRASGGDPTVYLAEEVAGYVAEGFRAVKIKLGFGVAADVKVMESVRAAVGSDVQLMIDTNHGYDAIDAVRLARAIEHLDIAWFEEPVCPEDLDGYRQVKVGRKRKEKVRSAWACSQRLM